MKILICLLNNISNNLPVFYRCIDIDMQDLLELHIWSVFKTLKF